MYTLSREVLAKSRSLLRADKNWT